MKRFDSYEPIYLYSPLLFHELIGVNINYRIIVTEKKVWFHYSYLVLSCLYNQYFEKIFMRICVLLVKKKLLGNIIAIA